MTCLLHWFGPRLCLGSHCVRFNSSNEMVQTILLFTVMLIRPYVGLATRPRVRSPRPRLCLGSHCVRYKSSNETVQALLLLIVMFMQNYDGFASPPRVSRPRRDFFSKLIAKGGDACCVDSLPTVDKEILVNQDLVGILSNASMVHAFVIPNQASPLATFEIDAEENSIVASKVCFSIPLIAFIVFGQPQLGLLLPQIESQGRSDGCHAFGECSCSTK